MTGERLVAHLTLSPEGIRMFYKYRNLFAFLHASLRCDGRRKIESASVGNDGGKIRFEKSILDEKIMTDSLRFRRKDSAAMKALWGVILLLCTPLYLSSAGAQSPKVNTIDLTTAIADVAQMAMPAVVTPPGLLM